MNARGTVTPAGEVRRLRAELLQQRSEMAELQQRYDALLTASAPDMSADLGWWLSVFREIHAADLDAEYRRGRDDEAAEMAAAWHEAANPIARADLGLHLRRWHLCCTTCRRNGHQAGCMRCEDRTRATFSQPHADDRPEAAA